MSPISPRAFVRLLAPASRLLLGACLIVAAQAGVARSADSSATIVLLPAGERASVVVAFDNERPNATAIEAPDNHSFDVEIGPVRSKVSNQLLLAATESPLVSQVRVRAAPGAGGTIVTLHVIAKSPVSGLVRRAQRRIYIDLEPLSVASTSGPADRSAAARRDAADAGEAGRAAGPASASPHAAGAPTTADPVAPRAGVTGRSESSTTSALPPASPTALTTPTAATSVASSRAESDATLRRAEAMSRQADVRGLEKLKADLVAHRTSPASGSASGSSAPDPMITSIDRYLDEARKNQLLADARLFKDSQSPAASATPASAPPAPSTSPEQEFQRAITALIPDLEKMTATLAQWQPGVMPSPILPQSLEALSLRLRALRPPVPLRASHERLCAALAALAKSWIPAPDGISLVPIGNDTLLMVSAKTALHEYLHGIASVLPTIPKQSSAPLS